MEGRVTRGVEGTSGGRRAVAPKRASIAPRAASENSIAGVPHRPLLRANHETQRTPPPPPDSATTGRASPLGHRVVVGQCLESAVRPAGVVVAQGGGGDNKALVGGGGGNKEKRGQQRAAGGTIRDLSRQPQRKRVSCNPSPLPPPPLPPSLTSMPLPLPGASATHQHYGPSATAIFYGRLSPRQNGPSRSKSAHAALNPKHPVQGIRQWCCWRPWDLRIWQPPLLRSEGCCLA